jgi:hypothetical protein
VVVCPRGRPACLRVLGAVAAQTNAAQLPMPPPRHCKSLKRSARADLAKLENALTWQLKGVLVHLHWRCPCQLCCVPFLLILTPCLLYVLRFPLPSLPVLPSVCSSLPLLLPLWLPVHVLVMHIGMHTSFCQSLFSH